jgi:hypothetical protein
LRYYHAQQAENLAGRTFVSPNSEDPIFLIEDRDLRDAYGQTIGKIAHSHHWDVDRLTTALRSEIGAMAGFPREWTVNAIKVAALLRCADAAHIDANRAPTMLFSLLSPAGLSKEHWNFQNRLLKNNTIDGEIIVTSGRAFKEDDAEAWWLCYDAVQLIDREIRQSNSLLKSLGCSGFAVHGVAGVESPKLFSRYVECEDWIPVNIEVKVSDARGLASTLGGRNLYGDGYAAPLKELLQNAADAIRARRSLEGRQADWGHISISLESNVVEDGNGGNEVWLHIDDDGIGMSEAVLTGPLVDLGNSFWKSNLMSFEYPGLQAKRPKTIGKFGIGFFSVFILGNEVKVVSRPCKAAESDGRVIHFKSLDRKPLFRSARSGEIPKDFVTRISVKLHHYIHQQMRHERVPQSENKSRIWTLNDEVLWQCSTLDVNVGLATFDNAKTIQHQWDWWALRKEDIAETMFSKSGISVEKCRQLGRYCEFLRVDGEVVGFGAIRLIAERFGFEDGYVSVQGISYMSDTQYSQEEIIVGMCTGTTEDASRKKAVPNYDKRSLLNWVNEQATLLPRLITNPIDRMEVANKIKSFGGDSGDLPIVFAGGTFLDFSEFSAWLKHKGSVSLPADNSYYLSLEGFGDLSAKVILSNSVPDLVLVSNEAINLGELSDLSIDRNSVDPNFLDFEEVRTKMAENGCEWLPNFLAVHWDEQVTVEYLRVPLRADSILSDDDFAEIVRFQRDNSDAE